jgi:hypothetical protein
MTAEFCSSKTRLKVRLQYGLQSVVPQAWCKPVSWLETAQRMYYIDTQLVTISDLVGQ